MNVITKYIKPITNVLSNTRMVNNADFRMPSGFDTKGLWKGWYELDIKKHLDSVKEYVKTLPPKPKDNGRGC